MFDNKMAFKRQTRVIIPTAIAAALAALAVHLRIIQSLVECSEINQSTNNLVLSTNNSINSNYSNNNNLNANITKLETINTTNSTLYANLSNNLDIQRKRIDLIRTKHEHKLNDQTINIETNRTNQTSEINSKVEKIKEIKLKKRTDENLKPFKQINLNRSQIKGELTVDFLKPNKEDVDDKLSTFANLKINKLKGNDVLPKSDQSKQQETYIDLPKMPLANNKSKIHKTQSKQISNLNNNIESRTKEPYNFNKSPNLSINKYFKYEAVKEYPTLKPLLQSHNVNNIQGPTFNGHKQSEASNLYPTLSTQASPFISNHLSSEQFEQTNLDNTRSPTAIIDNNLSIYATASKLNDAFENQPYFNSWQPTIKTQSSLLSHPDEQATQSITTTDNQADNFSIHLLPNIKKQVQKSIERAIPRLARLFPSASSKVENITATPFMSMPNVKEKQQVDAHTSEIEDKPRANLVLINGQIYSVIGGKKFQHTRDFDHIASDTNEFPIFEAISVNANNVADPSFADASLTNTAPQESTPINSLTAAQQPASSLASQLLANESDDRHANLRKYRCDRPRHIIQADKTVTMHILKSQSNFVIARVPIKKVARPPPSVSHVIQQNRQLTPIFVHTQPQSVANYPLIATTANSKSATRYLPTPITVSNTHYIAGSLQQPAMQPLVTTTTAGSLLRKSLWQTLNSIVDSLRPSSSASSLRPLIIDSQGSASLYEPSAAYTYAQTSYSPLERRYQHVNRVKKLALKPLSKKLEQRINIWRSRLSMKSNTYVDKTEQRNSIEKNFKPTTQVPSISDLFIQSSENSFGSSLASNIDESSEQSDVSSQLDPMRQLLMLRTATDSEVCSPVEQLGNRIKYSCIPNYCVQRAVSNAMQNLALSKGKQFHTKQATVEQNLKPPTSATSHVQVHQFEDQPNSLPSANVNPIITYQHANAYRAPYIAHQTQPMHQHVFVPNENLLDSLANNDSFGNADANNIDDATVTDNQGIKTQYLHTNIQYRPLEIQQHSGNEQSVNDSLNSNSTLSNESGDSQVKNQATSNTTTTTVKPAIVFGVANIQTSPSPKDFTSSNNNKQKTRKRKNLLQVSRVNQSKYMKNSDDRTQPVDANVGDAYPPTLDAGIGPNEYIGSIDDELEKAVPIESLNREKKANSKEGATPSRAYSNDASIAAQFPRDSTDEKDGEVDDDDDGTDEEEETETYANLNGNADDTPTFPFVKPKSRGQANNNVRVSSTLSPPYDSGAASQYEQATPLFASNNSRAFTRQKKHKKQKHPNSNRKRVDINKEKFLTHNNIDITKPIKLVDSLTDETNHSNQTESQLQKTNKTRRHKPSPSNRTKALNFGVRNRKPNSPEREVVNEQDNNDSDIHSDTEIDATLANEGCTPKPRACDDPLSESCNATTKQLNSKQAASGRRQDAIKLEAKDRERITVPPHTSTRPMITSQLSSVRPSIRKQAATTTTTRLPYELRNTTYKNLFPNQNVQFVQHAPLDNATLIDAHNTTSSITKYDSKLVTDSQEQLSVANAVGQSDNVPNMQPQFDDMKVSSKHSDIDARDPHIASSTRNSKSIVKKSSRENNKRRSRIPPTIKPMLNINSNQIDNSTKRSNNSNNDEEMPNDEIVVPHQYQIQLRWNDSNSIEGLQPNLSPTANNHRDIVPTTSGNQLSLDQLRDNVRDRLFEHREEEHWHDRKWRKLNKRPTNSNNNNNLSRYKPEDDSKFSYDNIKPGEDTPLNDQLDNRPTKHQVEKHFVIPTENFRQSQKFVAWAQQDVDLSKDPREPPSIFAKS